MLVKKVIVVGDGACGKTSLSVVFSHNEFPEEHIPTIFNNYTKTIEMEDRFVELSIWDTAGEEDYDRLRPLSYSGANVVLVCFAINNPDSLHNVVKKWVPELKYFCRKVPLILVGNKLDLRRNLSKTSSSQRLVRYEEAMKVKKKIKAVSYIECSAKLMIGVKQVFFEAAQATMVNIKQRNTICCFAKCKKN